MIDREADGSDSLEVCKERGRLHKQRQLIDVIRGSCFYIPLPVVQGRALEATSSNE